MCHSLGGLVLKQALVLAQLDSHFKEIYGATYGIIFLGTPHSGSNVASFVKSVGNVISIAFPGSQMKLIEDLKKDSVTLFNLSDEFRRIASELEIVSFYEQRETAIRQAQSVRIALSTQVYFFFLIYRLVSNTH